MRGRRFSYAGPRRLDEAYIQFEQAVKNIDRPKWHPDKAAQMIARYKVRYEEVQSFVKAARDAIVEAGVPTGMIPNYLRPLLAAFRIVKGTGGRAPAQEYASAVCYAAQTSGVDIAVLNELLLRFGFPRVQCGSTIAAGGGGGGAAAGGGGAAGGFP